MSKTKKLLPKLNLLTAVNCFIIAFYLSYKESGGFLILITGLSSFILCSFTMIELLSSLFAKLMKDNPFMEQATAVFHILAVLFYLFPMYELYHFDFMPDY